MVLLIIIPGINWIQSLLLWFTVFVRECSCITATGNFTGKVSDFIVSLCTPFLDRKILVPPWKLFSKGGLNSSYEAVYEEPLCAVWMMNAIKNSKNACQAVSNKNQKTNDRAACSLRSNSCINVCFRLKDGKIIIIINH